MINKDKFIILGFLSCISLGACSERENPLRDKHPLKLAYAISKFQLDGVKECSETFAFPNKASKAEINACNQLLPSIAENLNAISFADQEILPRDLQTPVMWQAFNTKYNRK